VWQCSTLRQLRIAAQLPLHAGQFQPSRLAALEVSDCGILPASIRHHLPPATRQSART
jgi:hypothetical protein